MINITEHGMTVIQKTLVGPKPSSSFL